MQLSNKIKHKKNTFYSWCIDTATNIKITKSIIKNRKAVDRIFETTISSFTLPIIHKTATTTDKGKLSH